MAFLLYLPLIILAKKEEMGSAWQTCWGMYGKSSWITLIQKVGMKHFIALKKITNPFVVVVITLTCQAMPDLR
jgi:hypothetical protein